MTVANPVQYFGKDLEAMSFAVNYHKWILDWPGVAALAGRAEDAAASLGTALSLTEDPAVRAHLKGVRGAGAGKR